VGRHDFVKGFGLLQRAWERSGVARSGAVWVTVGGAAPQRAPGRVITGSVPHREGVDWIHAADVGALPSYYEGWSVAPLEMLAGGLPALAHDVGNAAEVITGAKAGRILAPTVDAWAAAIPEALTPRAGARAPALGPEFRWSEIAARVDETYRELF